MKHQNSQQVLTLLQPNIQIKGKESFQSDKIGDEVLYHIRSNFENAEHQQYFTKFISGFLTHSKLIDQSASKAKVSPTITNEIFSAFGQCVSGFEGISDQPYMDGKWVAAVVDHLGLLLTQYGIEADQEIHSSKEAKEMIKQTQEYKSANAMLEKAQSTLETMFSRLQKCSNPPPNNKKFAAFFLCVRLTKIQFRLNNYKQCARWFQWIDTSTRAGEGYSMDMLPEKLRVMLAYYRGRFHLYRNEFVQARNELRYAFANCHQDYPKNKKKILRFLIPVEMNLNKFPTELLLKKYQLSEYLELSDACMSGDLLRFEQTIDQNMEIYVQSGVFLAVEKLRFLTIRNLIKRVELAIQKEPTLQPGLEEQPHNIRLENIFHIMNEWDSELDLDELECIIANQIYLGLIKGYISHEKRVLVLAKQDPFPLKSV